MEEREEGTKTIIGGDFNARTGEDGGWIGDEEQKGGEKGRRSKDKKVNGEGRRLLECIEKRGWSILNGSIGGDEEGEYTYVGGRGGTVIDYILGDEEVREKVERLEIGEEVESDHQPVIAWVRGRVGRGEERQGEK